MQFISTSLPAPSKGRSFQGIKKQVVPDLSMSLQEILTRFTRGEAVPVGRDGNFDENADTDDSVDYEKLAKADLVDKEEHYNKLEEVKKAYEKQEKVKAKKKHEKEEADKKAAFEARVMAEAEKLAQGKGNLPNA